MLNVLFVGCLQMSCLVYCCLVLTWFVDVRCVSSFVGSWLLFVSSGVLCLVVIVVFVVGGLGCVVVVVVVGVVVWWGCRCCWCVVGC